ncbi:MAG: hypothetical protein ACK41W_12705 [Cyanobacteriota bacterium]|jgi:hypothetical protein
MRSARTQPAAVLAAGGLAIIATLAGPSAQAAPCVSTTVDWIFNNAPYICELGGTVEYTFGTDLADNLSGGTLSFMDGPTAQTIKITGLSLTNPIVGYTFGVNVLSPSFEIADATQTYTTSTPFDAVLINSVVTPGGFPISSQNLTTSFRANGGNLTSMTMTIEKTPTPLPILGAGAALGFSRKLRRRIRQTR